MSRLFACIGQFALALAILTVAAPVLVAQSGPKDPANSADWPLEKVRLLDGKIYQGLIMSEGPSTIELAEVRRLPNKPMNLVIHSVERKNIATWDRLPEAEQKVLRDRIEQFRYRGSIEATRMNDLFVEAQVRDDVLHWVYRGNWFSLDSTADEQTTRRAIVRIEQVFLAYRQILPPLTMPQQRLQMKLFGATDQYKLFLRGLGVDISNPAFFLANFNLVVAGSDMNNFVDEMAKVRRRHQEVLEEMDKQFKESQAEIKALGEQLLAGGIPDDERQKILKAETRKWDEQRNELRRHIIAIERKNALRFNEVAGQMFTRLYHEAFHAYLENYVYPQQRFEVPRWLNEGLAQTFESGFIEADTLRIDAPNQRALLALQEDLKGKSPLPLAELLGADASTFLVAHRGGVGNSSRLYLYSWGLAYYLVFVQGALNKTAFVDYITPGGGGLTDVERFEQLVGKPLDEFEEQWRAAMLKLK